MTDQISGERRSRTVARFPDRRPHAFRSPWPTASMTKCEDCGAYYKDHPMTRDAVFDPAAEMMTLGIDTVRDAPEDRERFAALVELLARYAEEHWTDQTSGIDFMREDAEEWIAEVVNYAREE